MKKTLILILLITIIPSLKVKGQNLAGGIKLESLSSNRTSYLYGEPILLHFSLSNQTDNILYNWKPSPGVNVQIELIDLISGNKISDKFYSSDNPKQRYRWSQESPKDDNSFQPFQTYFFNYLIGEAFSTETIYKPSGKEAAVINRYASVLPEGKYRINVEFTLLPSDEKIIETHTFSVDKVPADMRKAFEDYSEALKYTAGSHPVYGDRSYSFSHNNSIENYLKMYPENAYSQHLMHILTNWIYPYFKKEGLDKDRTIMIRKYLDDDKLLPELRVERALRAGVLVRNFGKQINKKEIFDKALKGVKNQNSSVSDWVIDLGKKNHNLKNLKNYACQ